MGRGGGVWGEEVECGGGGEVWGEEVEWGERR